MVLSGPPPEPVTTRVSRTTGMLDIVCFRRSERDLSQGTSFRNGEPSRTTSLLRDERAPFHGYPEFPGRFANEPGGQIPSASRLDPCSQPMNDSREDRGPRPGGPWPGIPSA